MINNLFSIFDPNTRNIFKINWLSSILVIFLLPINYFFLKSRIIFTLNNFIILIHNEIKIIIKFKFNISTSLFFRTLIYIILTNNFIGIFPYIFTRSRHIIFSLSISLPLWISIIIFSWFKNNKFIFSHIIPQGTPNFLIPFIVLIESIRNFIRPWTLTIRLSANIIAGHLLISLIRNSPENLYIIVVIIIIQIPLLILEFSVSIIQSYVFTILRTLYTKETN